MTAPLFLRLVTPQLFAGKPSRLSPAKKSVFILSTGRTGTVYLADILNQLDGVLAAHEPKPSRVLNAWTTAYLEGKVADRFMAAALAGKRQNLANLDLEFYVESNNFIAGFASSLDQVFKNASVIHIVRDPRDFVTSLTNRGDASGIRGLFNKYVPYWAYRPKGVRKSKLTAYTRPAYRWMAINQFLSDWGKNHPSNYHFFKFEEVFDKKNPVKLKPLLRAIGLTDKQISRLDFAAKPRPAKASFSLLDKPASSQNQSKIQIMAKWRNWSQADKQAVADICEPLMRRYGYGGEPDWQNGLKIS